MNYEKTIRWLIIYSLAVYFVELSLSDVPSNGFFLWNERVVALILTADYFASWRKNRHYPLTVVGFLDILSFAPFWIGFFLPISHLGWIRALRVLRLLKLSRHNKATDHLTRAFSRVKQELSMLGYFVIVVVVFSSVMMYQLEHDAQPDKFLVIFDAVWWSIVTLTTIGYGDIYPITVPGRIVGMLTMICGVGIFGTFISLMGGSLVEVFKEERIAREKKEREEEDVRESY